MSSEKKAHVPDAEELPGDPTAALEMSRFCDFVDRFAFAPRTGIIARSEA